MRLVFAGTPDVAVPSLDAIAASWHELVAVVSRPDAPAGRGRHLVRSPVAAWADERGIEVLTLPVQLVQVEKHLSKCRPPARREPVIIP